MIWWTSVFGSPTSSAINHTCKRRSLSRTIFTRATLFSVLAVEGRPARCSSSTLSLPSLNALCHLKTKQHPHKLSSTIATFRNQTFRVSRRTWSRNAAPDLPAFSPVTRHKLLRTLLMYRLLQRCGLNWARSNYTWVPPPSTTTATILFWPFCAAQRNHSHYFWDRPCMGKVKRLKLWWLLYVT